MRLKRPCLRRIARTPIGHDDRLQTTSRRVDLVRAAAQGLAQVEGKSALRIGDRLSGRLTVHGQQDVSARRSLAGDNGRALTIKIQSCDGQCRMRRRQFQGSGPGAKLSGEPRRDRQIALGLNAPWAFTHGKAKQSEPVRGGKAHPPEARLVGGREERLAKGRGQTNPRAWIGLALKPHPVPGLGHSPQKAGRATIGALTGRLGGDIARRRGRGRRTRAAGAEAGEGQGCKDRVYERETNGTGFPGGVNLGMDFGQALRR